MALCACVLGFLNIYLIYIYQIDTIAMKPENRQIHITTVNVLVIFLYNTNKIIVSVFPNFTVTV